MNKIAKAGIKFCVQGVISGTPINSASLNYYGFLGSSRKFTNNVKNVCEMEGMVLTILNLSKNLASRKCVWLIMKI